jgi:diketogulonate reductase-like aldo/keto reductase
MSLPKVFRLSSGYTLPAITFGTYEAIPEKHAALKQAIIIALKTGYLSIDTAWTYGTERLVGDAIRESGVPREEIFLTTKVYDSFIQNK